MPLKQKKEEKRERYYIVFLGHAMEIPFVFESGQVSLSLFPSINLALSFLNHLTYYRQILTSKRIFLVLLSENSHILDKIRGSTKTEMHPSPTELALPRWLSKLVVFPEYM